jgi:hypothetical protein
MIYQDAQVILSTDAHDVMRTTMREEYLRAHRLIEEVLAGERKVRVRAADAKGRGVVAGGTDGPPGGDRAVGERWLSVEDFTPAELDRFLRGYEKLHADAAAYYLHRPRPAAGTSRNEPSDASPAGGAHWTDTAHAHRLFATEGQRRFAGTRSDVEAAVAAYRREGATALPIDDAAGTVIYRVTAPDGRATLELEGWSESPPGYLPVPDLDDPFAAGFNGQLRQWYKDAVKDLPTQDAAWQAEGLGLEERARRAYQIRHHARLQARQMMRRESEVAGLHLRDLGVYGDPDGPSFEQLVDEGMKAGKTRDEALQGLIGSARRTNAAYDRRHERPRGGSRE